MDNIAHVDTDSCLVNSIGLANLRTAYSGQFNAMWQIKATWQTLLVYGPRNLRAGRERKVAGVSKKAVETSPNVFDGERWRGLAADMMLGRADSVTVIPAHWEVNTEDPRRRSAGGTGGRTVAIAVNTTGD